MSNEGKGSEGNNGGGTGEPAATNNPSNSATPSGGSPDSKTIAQLEAENASLRKSNQDLTAQRDKNHEEGKGNADWIEQKRQEEARDEAISSFIDENKETYPDVTAEDLKLATSPEELSNLAKRVQSRVEDIRQNELSKMQASDMGTITPDEEQKLLDDLDPEDPDAFEKSVDIGMRTKR